MLAQVQEAAASTQAAGIAVDKQDIAMHVGHSWDGIVWDSGAGMGGDDWVDENDDEDEDVGAYPKKYVVAWLIFFWGEG